MTDQHHAAAPPPTTSESNGVGLAGFIVSLVGLVSCGVLSPIGLILSFIGLFRQPKGFAIAGFVLGLLGSAWILVFVFVLGLAGFAMVLGAVGFQGQAELIRDGLELGPAAERYYQSQGTLPASASELPNLDEERYRDNWGNEYRLEADEQTGEIRIISNGPDGQPDTNDDLEGVFGEVNLDASP